MKLTSLSVFCLLFTICAKTQTYTISWSDETKMKKATVDMKLVGADNTGVYFLEGDLRMKSYFVIGASFKTAYKLKKFDGNFNEVYEKDYRKELRDVSLSSIKPLRNKLFLFANHYNKKENVYSIYASEIDKSSGDLQGELTEIGNYTLESDKDDVDYILKPLPDSAGWLLVTSITARDKSSNNAYVTSMDLSLRKKQSAFINLKTDPHLFNLEDIAFTKDNKLLILGKQFEELDNGKRKKKVVLKNYTLTRYDIKGKEETAYKFQADNNRYLIGGKLLTLPGGETVFAGFYSNTGDIKHQQLNGIYTARLSANADTLIQNSSMAVSQSMLTDLSDSIPQDDDDDAKADRKKHKDNDDADEGFSNSFVIRNITVNPADKSVIIIAESYKYTYHVYTYTNYNSSTHMTSYRTETRYSFSNSDLLIINASAGGIINRINLIPKKQLETITNSDSYGNGLHFNNNVDGLFADGGAYPYYSSISSLIVNNNLLIFYNDDDRNAEIKNGNDAKNVKRVYNFKKTSLYALSIDLASGDLKKKNLFDNSDDLIAMPRFGYVTGNNLYLPASKQKILGKTELKIGRIIIK